MIQAREAVHPRLADAEELREHIQMCEVDSEVVCGMIAQLALEDRWLPIYQISALVVREVSILVDAENSVWVDWGEPGQVQLSPPAGSRLPFRLWVHTHPRGGAYWSDTDRGSLATASTILKRALVLGRNGVLQTVHTDCEQQRLSEDGPLHSWTDEEVQIWRYRS